MSAAPRFRTIEKPQGRLYAIGDIHGCLEELGLMIEFLKSSEKLGQQDQLVFIGDYVDRGPESKQVVQYLVDLSAEFPKTVFLKGNHEDMLLSYLGIEGDTGIYYLQNGGRETLLSYGVKEDAPPSELLAAIPESHLRFYRSLDRYAVTDSCVFVHAGLNPLVKLEDQIDDDIFWIRDEFIMNIHHFNKLVVFGHTPFEDVLVHAPYKLGIDTGLVFGHRLSCVEFSCGHLMQIERSKRELRARDILLQPPAEQQGTSGK